MKTKSFIGILLFIMFISTLGISSSNPIILKHDSGYYSGYSGSTTTHQVEPGYKIMKIIDVSSADLEQTVEARVRVFIGLIDYSREQNGFNEEIELVVNEGKIKVPLNLFHHGKNRGQTPSYEWCDISIPHSYLKPGQNKIVINKVKHDPQDDYIYVAIDNHVKYGRSACSLDNGKTWNYEKLNAVNATGEYMIRLVLHKSPQQDTDLVKYVVDEERDVKVNLTPVVNTPVGEAKIMEPSVAIDDSECVINNGYYSMKLSYAPNIVLSEVRTAYTKWENVLNNNESEVFWFKIGDRKISSRDFRVIEIKKLEEPKNGVSIELLLEELEIEATLTLTTDSTNEMKMGLTFCNNGTEEIQIKTVFPHLAGINISDSYKDDYYLFPLYGGIISNKSAYIHAGYGQASSLWQMVDIYSPSKGTGVYIRIDDANGLYKAIELVKGDTPNTILAGVGYQSSTNLDIGWAKQVMVESSQGTGVAFGYKRYNIAPGENFKYPDAVIGIHPGDWHEAMERYSQWAHEIWEWRPYPSTITDAYNMKFGPGLPEQQMIVDGRWRDAKSSIGENKDLLELQHWWKWSELGPWSVPVEDDLKSIREAFGDSYINSTSWAYPRDPFTGNRNFINLRGNWDREDNWSWVYNNHWGGKEALRTYVDSLKQEYVVVALYTDPYIVLDPSDFAHDYGEELGVMNPIWSDAHTYNQVEPEGYVTLYSSWNMCVDNEFYQDFFAERIKEVCTDIGAGIRLDEVGYNRPTCYSDKHDHVFAEEPGDEVFFQATAEFVRKVREAMDEVDPSLILTSEGPGYDFLMHKMDGGLFYNSGGRHFARHELTPLELDLIRFYFPEYKTFDYFNKNTESKYYEQAFWQARGLAESSGVYKGSYKSTYYRILRENADAYRGDSRLLEPTLANYVYVNKFATDEKMLIHFYNDNEEEIKGIVMDIPYENGYHYFDLIEMKETAICIEEGLVLLKSHLLPEKAGCIAKLPSLLGLDKKANDYYVKIKFDVIEQSENLKLEVFDKEHNVLYQVTSCNEENLIPSAVLAAKPSHIKLFRDGYLLDVITFE